MSSESGEQTADEPTVFDDLKKWRAVDDIDGLRRRVHRAVRAAEAILYAEEATISERLKACTVIQQSARTHLKLIDADEIEARIEALEEAVQRIEERRNGIYHN